MTPHYSDPLVTLYLGDCLDVMRELPDASVDSVVTDPPYGLEFMGKEWDRLGGAGFHAPKDEGRTFTNESGHMWDNTKSLPRFGSAKASQAWHEQWATEAFRVLKPGGYLLAFGGTRTYHRLASAIEDAGFEIRDTLMWIYASGFPKSLDVSKALDAAMLTGKTNSKALRAANEQRPDGGANPYATRRGSSGTDMGRATAIEEGYKTEATRAYDGQDRLTAPATDLARKWEGWGTALKPAHEPIVMARKPLVGTVAQNVTRYGTGALNIDGTRIGTTGAADSGWAETKGDGPKFIGQTYNNGKASEGPDQSYKPGAGRWPSNVLLSSPELFDDPNPGVVGSGATVQGAVSNGSTGDAPGYEGGWRQRVEQKPGYGDSGGYSRFFLVPKADRAERERGLAGAPKEVVNITEGHGRGPVNTSKGDGTGIRVNHPRANVHPTVKPIDLMRHLVKLVTPPGGTVLDPFAGSGTTGLASSELGIKCILVEREAEYCDIVVGRLIATPMGLGLVDGDAA